MNKKPTTKYLPANTILGQQGQLGPLVLGDCNSAVDHSILKKNRVQTILSIGLEAQPPKNKMLQDIKHRVFDIHDNKQQKLGVQLLDEVSGLIEEGRRKGGVLVHCYAGVSRSSSFVIAYLIQKYIISYDDAKEKAKKKRPCVHPGDGFVHQLKNYAKVIQRREEERLAGLKESPEKQVKEYKNQSSALTERTRRGVRGAVRSAQGYIPEDLKYSLNEKMIENNKKVELKPQQEKKERLNKSLEQQKAFELPPINMKKEILQERYRACSSRDDLKYRVQKIEGKQGMEKGRSVQKIYKTKTKVM